MHSSLTRIALASAIVASTLPRLVLSQTSSVCNPLTQGGCPADAALGKSANFDFTAGASDSFTPVGSPTFTSQGAGFPVAKPGDSPQIVSERYIMFGHVEFVIKAAPGTGIVSSAVLISDCLDEIDWEWIGGDDSTAQSNYFGKGMTTTYNRGASHPVTCAHDQFHKYTIDWTAEQIVWQIDGVTVRAMTVANAAQGQYPQTPMQIKVGTWSGGDPSNPPGTVAWAGGQTDYTAGPSTMYLQSMAVTDYSTGTSYTYSGTDGTWQSIKSKGGSIGEKSGSNTAAQTAAAAQVSSVSVNSAPIPFEGTHKDSTSTFVTPSGWPWIGSATATLRTAASTGAASIAGLPSGWTVTSSGKVLPPSAGAQGSLSTWLPPLSSSDSSLPSGAEVVATYDQSGFLTSVTRYAMTTFTDQRSPITSQATVPTSKAAAQVGATTSESKPTLMFPTSTPSTNEAYSRNRMKVLGGAAGMGLLGVALLI